MYKIGCLSKSERANAQDSEIAREGKELIMQIKSRHGGRRGRANCLQCGDIAVWLKHDFGPAIPYVDKIKILLGKIWLQDDQLCDKPEHPNFGMEVALLIEQLPSRFDNMKVSYQHYCTASMTQTPCDDRPNVDSLVNRLKQARPSFVFDCFTFSSYVGMTNSAELQEYMFSHARRLEMIAQGDEHNQQVSHGGQELFITPSTRNSRKRPL